MEKIYITCKTCGNRWETIYPECPQMWVCNDCKIESEDAEYSYRLRKGDIETELE